MNNPRRILFTAAFALIGAFLGIAGTGHAYLRRWKRSLLWLVLTLGTLVLLTNQYVPDGEAIDPFDVGSLPAEVLVPIVIILGINVFDAILVAYLDTKEESEIPEMGSDSAGEDEVTCPHCGKATDSELDFCTWCTEPLEPEEEQTAADAVDEKF